MALDGISKESDAEPSRATALPAPVSPAGSARDVFRTISWQLGFVWGRLASVLRVLGIVLGELGSISRWLEFGRGRLGSVLAQLDFVFRWLEVV